MTLAEALKRNTELEIALAASLAQNEELRARIQVLEERLGQNSRNSSKPPSSDGPTVKRPPRSHKKAKKRGGQPGHAGQTRAMVSIDAVDEIHECLPVACSQCGAGLAGMDPEPLRHQVAEIPEPRIIWHEYRLHRLACAGCGCVTAGQLPSGVSASHFGPRLHGLVALLTGGWLLSKRQAAALLTLLYGLEMSPSSISAMERRMAKALAQPVAAAHAYVKAAEAAHADETSWREAKDRAWLWVAATSLVIVFMIHRRRNTEAAKELLGADFTGALCVDRWSAYTWVERRGLCWAHLMRDFQAMTERSSGQWYGQRLVASGQRVLATWSAWHGGQIDRTTLEARIGPERVQMQRWLELGSKATWAPNKTRAVCRDLLAHQDAMWRFLAEPALPPTNNLAERCLRKPVLWRKGSFGTDSPDGSRFVERILTVVATLRAQDRDPLAFLVDAHVAFIAGQPAPSLLPG